MNNNQKACYFHRDFSVSCAPWFGASPLFLLDSLCCHDALLGLDFSFFRTHTFKKLYIQTTAGLILQ